MASFSPSPNSPPVSGPPLPPRLFPPPPTATPPSSSSPPPQSPPPPSTTAPPPSSPPPSPDSSPPPPTSPPLPPAPPSPPPPATAPPPSTPPISSSPPVSSSPTTPTNSPNPPSPSPPTTSPSPPSPSPPTTSPPTSSPSPPARSPPPPTSPSRSPPPTSPPRSPPPPNPSSSLSPPPSSPPRNSPPPGPKPSSPPQNSPPPSPLLPPRRSPPPSPLLPPRSSPPPPILNPPPPRTPPTNSSTPPVITPPSTNPSPPVVLSPPSFRQSPPSPSQVLLSPPGNPNNNDSSPNTPSSDPGIGTGGIVGIGVVVGVVLLTLIIVVSWCVIKRKKKLSGHNGPYIMPTSMGTSPTSDSGLLKIETGSQPSNHFVYSPQEPGGLGNSRPKFSYEDLAEATNGFSVQNLLGSGGFGSVYKGILADGTEVAVKELNIGGGQGEREFSAEVEIISRIHHRHLVSLVGYCVSENKRLLVYEYVPNNTLYFHLHGSGTVLDWATRVRVASGAARGIAYLHEDCQPRIIHRDIKSSNILLDQNFEARVSDFGLARLAADANTHITTRVMGTFGYLAPEYASSGKLTDKSDVYSFGVVLLELITGRKPVDTSRPLGDESLVEWARPLLSHALATDDFQELVDPRLGPNFVAIEMFRMIEAAAACVRHSAMKRPRMGQIMRAFESMETEDLNNGMRVGESEVFNSAEQSAEIRLFRRMAFGSQEYSTDFFTQGSHAHNSN